MPGQGAFLIEFVAVEYVRRSHLKHSCFPAGVARQDSFCLLVDSDVPLLCACLCDSHTGHRDFVSVQRGSDCAADRRLAHWGGGGGGGKLVGWHSTMDRVATRCER